MPYPAITSRRIPYDIDGTQVSKTSNIIADIWMTSQEKINMNSESFSGYIIDENWGASYNLYFFFPEKMEIEGIYMSGIGYGNWKLSSNLWGSNDTTNGQDGTWEAATYNGADMDPPSTYEWRSKVRPVSFSTSYKVLRVRINGNDDTHFQRLHIYGRKAAEAVACGDYDRGIIFCGTGIGISIAANRVKGARCALVTSVHMAKMARMHNDANMIALGGRILDKETALAIVDAFLNTEFEGGRHQRRIDMLNS